MVRGVPAVTVKDVDRMVKTQLNRLPEILRSSRQWQMDWKWVSGVADVCNQEKRCHAGLLDS